MFVCTFICNLFANQSAFLSWVSFCIFPEPESTSASLMNLLFLHVAKNILNLDSWNRHAECGNALLLSCQRWLTLHPFFFFFSWSSSSGSNTSGGTGADVGPEEVQFAGEPPDRSGGGHQGQRLPALPPSPPEHGTRARLQRELQSCHWQIIRWTAGGRGRWGTKTVIGYSLMNCSGCNFCKLVGQQSSLVYCGHVETPISFMFYWLILSKSTFRFNES